MANINIGIGKDLSKELKIGLFMALGFIIINFLYPEITIGMPDLPLATQSERFGIIGIIAPIVEELIFGFLMLLLLVNIFKTPIPIAIAISAVSFGLFHITAYAGSLTAQGILAASGALIGAMIFRIIANLFIINRHSIVPGIIMHAAFNIYILTTKLVVIGGS